MTTSVVDQSSCRILYRLEATEIDVGNAGKKSVAVVQPVTHKCLDQSMCRFRRQRPTDGVAGRSSFGRLMRSGMS